MEKQACRHEGSHPQLTPLRPGSTRSRSVDSDEDARKQCTASSPAIGIDGDAAETCVALRAKDSNPEEDAAEDSKPRHGTEVESRFEDGSGTGQRMQQSRLGEEERRRRMQFHGEEVLQVAAQRVHGPGENRSSAR